MKKHMHLAEQEVYSSQSALMSYPKRYRVERGKEMDGALALQMMQTRDAAGL